VTALNRGKRFSVYAVDELVLGGAIRQEDVALFGFEGANLGGDGLLAAGVVTSFSSDLDFDRGRWRVYPQGAPDTAGYGRLDGEVRSAALDGLSSRLYAAVVIDGARLRTIIDTGAPRTLTIDNATGVKLGLWAPGVPYAPARSADITGAAPAPGRLVRAGAVRIGENVYPGPLVMIHPPEVGARDAVLGLPLIRTLNLAFDKGSGTLWGKRNGLSVGGGAAYGGSGLWVDAVRGGVRVADVGVGSPAAAAGVQPGDMLEGVADLGAAVRELGRPDGATVSFRLRRPDGVREATFVLKRFL
jgi:serine protease Do